MAPWLWARRDHPLELLRSDRKRRLPCLAALIKPPPDMDNYPAPARARVAEMAGAAAGDPARAVAFQGAPGCNSHIAVAEAFSGALPLPCFSFEEALEAVSEGRADRAMIPKIGRAHV